MEPEKKPNGAVVGLIIIVTILIVGGIYIWQAKVKNTLMKTQTPVEDKTLRPSDTTDLDTLSKELDTTDPTLDVDTSTLK